MSRSLPLVFAVNPYVGLLIRCVLIIQKCRLFWDTRISFHENRRNNNNFERRYIFFGSCLEDENYSFKLITVEFHNLIK